MILVDTHTHLDDRRFDGDREEVIARALAANIGSMVTVGVDQSSSRRAVQLASAHPSIHATVGIHPHQAAHATEGYQDDLLLLGTKDCVVGIGEIGLDYHYNYSPPEAQRQVFVSQLQLARRLAKPIVVHDREAHRETMTLLKEHAQGLQGVLHCYSGDLQMAEEAIKMGLYISVAGPVTFRNASQLQQLVQELPLDHLLVETDCPYLAPHPHRGRRNEPAYSVLVAQKVADLKHLELKDVAVATTANARALFGLLPPAD